MHSASRVSIEHPAQAGRRALGQHLPGPLIDADVSPGSYKQAGASSKQQTGPSCLNRRERGGALGGLRGHGGAPEGLRPGGRCAAYLPGRRLLARSPWAQRTAEGRLVLSRPARKLPATVSLRCRCCSPVKGRTFQAAYMRSSVGMGCALCLSWLCSRGLPALATRPLDDACAARIGYRLARCSKRVSMWGSGYCMVCGVPV